MEQLIPMSLILWLSMVVQLGCYVLDTDVPESADSQSSEVNIDVFLNNNQNLVVPETMRFDQPFQSGFNCGPNSVFVVLRLLGVNVKYDDVIAGVSTNDRGSNMDQLVALASGHGVDLSPRKQLTVEDIVDAPKPMILHLDGTSGTDDGLQDDHFLVILHSDTTHGRRFFSAIDTTNFLPVQYRSDQIVRAMSGHGLIVSGAGGANSAATSILRVMAGVVLTVTIIVGMILLRRRKTN